MLALTFSTGVIDAVGFLGLDRVFTGNMTGNVVILGMALSGTTDLPVLGPALALVAFFLGAMLCGRMLRGRPDGWVGPTSVALVIVATVLVAVSVLLMVAGRHAFPFMTEGITSALGLVMGIQAAAARHIKVPDVTTVVVTSTITGLAADSRLGADKKQDWLKRFLAVLLILAGAVAGAGLMTFTLWLPISISGFLTIVVLLIGHLRRRAEKHQENNGGEYA
ncbi:YoaK family protein [Arthrobacter monumenti]